MKQSSEKEQSRQRVVVGLSGGVDSAVSAALLVEKGYEVTGVFLECWRAPGCRVDQDRKDALDVALKLGIPYEVLDFKKEYKERVVEYFYDEYKAGRTPNPDVVCNREIKFGLFYDWAMEKGFEYVATGHYARVRNGRLVRAIDVKKDQSYFLCQVGPEQLEHVMFPVGGLTKKQVRQMARRRGLGVADKPDSQGICFIGPVDVNKFLEERIVPVDGPVVNTQGEVIGKHRGVWFYTVGQRGGWTVEPKFQKNFEGEIPAYYVLSKDVKTNTLVVGFEKQLETKRFEVEKVKWYEPMEDKDVWVRIRNLGEMVMARLEVTDGGVGVVLDLSMRAVATGQYCVFYSDNSVNAVVVGYGIIV